MRHEDLEPQAQPRTTTGAPGLTRRRFLEGGVMAGASLWAAPSLLEVFMAREVRAADPTALPRIGDFLSRDQVGELLRIALAKGADFAEVYGEYTINTEVTLDEGKLKTLSYGVLSGAGLRAIRGEVTGYAYADDFDMKPARCGAHGRERRVGKQGHETSGLPHRRRQARFGSIDRCRRTAVKSRDHDLPADRPVGARHRQACTQRSGDLRDTAKRILVANSDGIFEEDDSS